MGNRKWLYNKKTVEGNKYEGKKAKLFKVFGNNIRNYSQRR